VTKFTISAKDGVSQLAGKLIHEVGPARTLGILPFRAEFPIFRPLLAVLARAAVLLGESLVEEVELRTPNPRFAKPFALRYPMAMIRG
jgi:hypothetical protein